MLGSVIDGSVVPVMSPVVELDAEVEAPKWESAIGAKLAVRSLLMRTKIVRDSELCSTTSRPASICCRQASMAK